MFFFLALLIGFSIGLGFGMQQHVKSKLYEEKYMEGLQDGFNFAFDTVNSMLKARQRESTDSTCVSMKMIENRDTLIYYLERR